MGIEFCHIAPTKHLDLVAGRSVHLVLAHLVEHDPRYVDFYLEEREKNKNVQIILDNSAFEMFKQGKPMYPSSKLLEMAVRVKADYIVMSDYPNEPAEKTIESAKKLAPEYHSAGFKTFFVPQSKIGDIKDLISGFHWAKDNTDLIDYVGVSILSCPNGYAVERGNKMQRFMSRIKFMYEVGETLIFPTLKDSGTKVHFLGMLDGPHEIMYASRFGRYVDTWDSSAAIWCGLNGIQFDNSPTGLINGKFEKEVDFNYYTDDNTKIELAKQNMNYIDRLCYAYLWR